MEMLNNFGTLLALNDDLWKILIGWFGQWMINYGWAIILFTICLKLIMSPLDFFQRKSSQKQQKVMSEMQPEMEKLQQKYGNDREKLNQESAKLYKKYNVNVGGMCFTMLITMVISMVVFFTLYSSLRAYGEEKLYVSYQQLESSYEQAVKEINEPTFEGNKEEYIHNAVKETYELQQKENSWLWVKNVWKSDTNVGQLADFEGYANYMRYDKESLDYQNKADIHTEIVKIVETENPGPNGYYVLIILSAVISFVTQFLSSKLLQQKGQKMSSMNLVMFIVIPITMFILAMTSNVVFTLYIIANSIMTVLISAIISLFTKRKNDNNDEKVITSNKRVDVVEYSRNYKK